VVIVDEVAFELGQGIGKATWCWAGLVRQYLPRTVDLRQFSQADLDQIAAEPNGRPRQTLGFTTPSPAFTMLLPCPVGPTW
jgi:hypothetical protein